MKTLLLFLISSPAFACMNPIDALDVETMISGKPHGKPFLSCSTKDCICIDGFDLETSVVIGRVGSKKLVVDTNKLEEKTKRLLLEAEQQKAREEMSRFLFDKIKAGTATPEETRSALKYLLEDMKK